MAMLAERKVKQKWSLNPRGKAWSEDSSKFGQKLLEKMGWSKGKGLGAKEDGITEHIKVSYKNDSKGMGFKDNTEQWTEHDANFNALLANLTGEKPENDLKLSSLEEKSQSSKVRVHYKKFTRGKDLSRYSEKDLANIFGKKSLIEKKIHEEEEIKESTVRDNFTHNGGSMVDYFKKKLPNFGKVASTESDEEQRVGFGFSNKAFDPLFNSVEVEKHVLNTIEEEAEKEENNERNKDDWDVTMTSEIDTANVKKKKRKFDEMNESNCQINDTFEVKRKKKKQNDTPECQMNDSASKEKKKKKKVVLEEINDTNEGIENLHFTEKANEDNFHVNNTFEVKRKKKVIEEAEESYINDSGIKKKKKKKVAVEEDCQINDTKEGIENLHFVEEITEDHGHVNNTFEVKRKKKKKKTVNEELEDSIDTKKKKKKKVVLEENCQINDTKEGTENLHFTEETTEDNCHVNNTFEVKRKKKTVNEKKKKKKPVLEELNVEDNSQRNKGIENPFFTEETEDNCRGNNAFEVKRKKKKDVESSKKKKGIENPNFDDDKQDSQINDTFEVKRKEKKKKKKEAENVNCSEKSNFTEADTSDMKCDFILNITSTEIATPSRKSVRFSDVTQERIIPSRHDTNSDITNFTRKIDSAEAEVENDINEQKMVGEVGSSDGENEKLPNGATKLKFKYAKFGQTPLYQKKAPGPKKSYKHLIKGDIVLAFNNTNLHEIVGYGDNKK